MILILKYYGNVSIFLWPIITRYLNEGYLKKRIGRMTVSFQINKISKPNFLLMVFIVLETFVLESC